MDQKRIRNIKELLLYAFSIDPDSGIRIKIGDNLFYFISREKADYLISKAVLIQGRLEQKEFYRLKNKKELEEFVNNNLKSFIEAYLY